jgi:hypothetical protein
MTNDRADGQRNRRSGHAIPLDTDRQALSDRRYRTLWGGSKSLRTIGPGAPGLVVIVVVDVGWVDEIIAG